MICMHIIITLPTEGQLCIIIDRDDLAAIVEAVECLAAEWDSLALKLGLRKADIDGILKKYPRDIKACLTDAMDLWLKENYTTEKFGYPSWRTLVKAVEKMNYRLARDIADSHRARATGILCMMWFLN